jgi:hypothetical protein
MRWPRRAETGGYGGMVDQLWRYVQWTSEAEWYVNMRPITQGQAMLGHSLITNPLLYCSIDVAAVIIA